MEGENAPLLRANREQEAEAIPGVRPERSRVALLAQHWSTWKVVYVAITFMSLINTGVFVGGGAQIRMLEDAICKRYYAQSPGSSMEVPEELCKVDPVQKELAYIYGMRGVVDSTFGVLVAIPWGSFADRKGRRLVPFLAITGELLATTWIALICHLSDTIPPRLTLVSSMLYIVGGGNGMVMVMVLAIIVQSVPEIMRTRILLYLHAAMICAVFIGTPIGAELLKRTTYWVPVILSLVIQASTLLLLIWMPSLPGSSQAHSVERPNVRMSSEIPPDAKTGNTFRNAIESLSLLLAQFLAQFGESFQIVAQNRELQKGLFVVFFTKIGQPLIMLLPQYVSKKFSWSLGNAIYILVVHAPVNILLLVVVLPAIAKLLTDKYHIIGPALDLTMLKYSIPFLSMGCILMGIAPSPPVMFIALVIYVGGSGYRASLESFLASTIDPRHLASLYMLISVTDNIALSVAYPFVAATFSWGIDLGGVWLGLPYGSGALFFLLALFASLTLRPGKSSGAESGAIVNH